MRSIFSVVFLFLVFGYAQVYHRYVTATSSFDATAYNNSHKIATQLGEWMYDSIHIVFHSNDSIFIVTSLDQGWTWQTPYYLCRGKHPALDIDQYRMRHIAWQQQDSVSGNYDVFYDCLEDYSPPINVSQSVDNSILPDVVVDSEMTAHITWIEGYSGYNDIYYRDYQGGVLGDTVILSSMGLNSSPSISIFRPESRVYVSWCCLDSFWLYHISYRYKDTEWSDIADLAVAGQTLGNPSLDFSHGIDSLSACWEDSTSGNLEATFYGGNQGGGYPTAGRSTYPVISTVWTTYSYYFWQEDSAGYEDIYSHLYYMMSGWYMDGSLRDYFMVTEPIRFPNVCGAYLTWTQGNSPPYGIWFACFGYPIGVEERNTINNAGYRFEITPNPFSTLITISVGMEQSADSKETNTLGTMPLASCVKIYDASGRVVKSFLLPAGHSLQTSVMTWDSRDDVGKDAPPGIYFVGIPGYGQMVKVVKLR